MTSVTYNFDSSNHYRDWTPICAWAIAEYAFVKQYRQKLLEGPAGAICVSFTNIFNMFACSANQATIGATGQLTSNSKFSWCDQLIVKDTDEVLKTTGAIDAEKAATRLSEQDRVQNRIAEIQRLTNIWENSPLCHNPLGKEGSVDKNISDALDKLIWVRGFIIVS